MKLADFNDKGCIYISLLLPTINKIDRPVPVFVSIPIQSYGICNNNNAVSVNLNPSWQMQCPL